MSPNPIPNASSDSNSSSKKQLYRRLLYVSILVGVAGSFTLRSLDYPLVGEGIYWLGIVAFLGIWKGTSLTLFDERDKQLERQASTITLLLFAVVLVVGASGARVLSEVGTYTVSSELESMLGAYAAQFVVFGIVYLVLRLRR